MSLYVFCLLSLPKQNYSTNRNALAWVSVWKVTMYIYCKKRKAVYLIKTHFQVLFFHCNWLCYFKILTLNQKIVMMFWISIYHVTTIKDMINSFVLLLLFFKRKYLKTEVWVFPKHVWPAFKTWSKIGHAFGYRKSVKKTKTF